MKKINQCAYCGSKNIRFYRNGMCHCDSCGKDGYPVEKYIESNLFEKLRAKVYATGNKWAIENWNLTH